MAKELGYDLNSDKYAVMVDEKDEVVDNNENVDFDSEIQLFLAAI